MKCPKCGFTDSKVIDSRPGDNSIRRRRECLSCQFRFTTYETYELDDSSSIVVIKKDKTLQIFDRNKIMTGLLQACYKRPVTREQLIALVNDVETAIRNTLKNEVTTKEIGNLVMERLKEIDEVSYVRFASVYREFKDAETFRNELNNLSKKEEQGT